MGRAGVGPGVRGIRGREVACVQVLVLMFLLLGLKQASWPASSFLLSPVLWVHSWV